MDYEMLYESWTKTENMPQELIGRDRSDVKLAVAERQNGNISLFPNFRYISRIFEPGDLLIFNDSLMLPSSLPAIEDSTGNSCRVHVGQPLSGSIYLAEIRPRYNFRNVKSGDYFQISNSGVGVEVVGKYEEFPRYARIRFHGLKKELNSFLLRFGKPIYYERITKSFDYKYYKNVFQDRLGSSEYPSASRPFNNEIMRELSSRGVQSSTITLHCNLASLERDEFGNSNSLLPEYYEVTEETAEKIRRATLMHKRIIAVGTTVARAILSSIEDGKFTKSRGVTTIKIGPETEPFPLTGIITGIHDAESSHHDLTSAFIGDLISEPLSNIVSSFNLGGHEFGDSLMII